MNRKELRREMVWGLRPDNQLRRAIRKAAMPEEYRAKSAAWKAEKMRARKRGQQ